MKLKNFYIIFTFLLIITFIFFLLKNYLVIITFLEELFFAVLEYKNNNFFKFLIIIFLLNLIYFLTPLPTTLIIIFNGFAFGNFGFFFSMFFVLVGSIAIFLFSKNFLKKNISKKNIFKFIKLKTQKLQFIQKPNNGIIFLSRYVIPYFIQNIIFGLYKIGLGRFAVIIFLAEIPMVLAINNIGKSLNNFILVNDYKIYDLFFDYQFLLSFLFIFSIILASSSIEKIIIKKK